MGKWFEPFAGCLGGMVFADTTFDMDTFGLAPCSQGCQCTDHFTAGIFTTGFPAATPQPLYLFSTLVFEFPNPLVKRHQLDVQCSSFIIKVAGFALFSSV